MFKVSKDITKTIRLNNNELSLINEYKLKYNIKTDSDAIRELIKNGLAVQGVGNKLLFNFLRDIKHNLEFNYKHKYSDSDLFNYYSDLNIITIIFETLSNLQHIDTFIKTWFYNENKNQYNYENFIKYCIEGNNKNYDGNDFLDILEKNLDYRYIKFYDLNNNYIVYETLQVYKILREEYQYYKYKDYLTYKDIKNLITNVKQQLIYNESSRSEDDQSLIKIQYEKDKIDIYNLIQSLKSDQTDNLIKHQHYKDLYMMLYLSRVNNKKVSEIMNMYVKNK